MQNQLINVVKLSQQHCKTPIACELAYATKENFLGRIVNGYHPEAKDFFLMTPQSAAALCKVQNILSNMNLGLFVFDSYRPLRAVKDFYQWMHSPVHDAYELERKKIHYPHIEKHQLAELGFVCDDVSNHCFGDTVDLTLIDLSTNQFLDMGACFDYFDELSYPAAPAAQIGATAFNNRRTLAAAMLQAGFLPYEKEYWHYVFKTRDILEPLDIEITANLA